MRPICKVNFAWTLTARSNSPPNAGLYQWDIGAVYGLCCERAAVTACACGAAVQLMLLRAVPARAVHVSNLARIARCSLVACSAFSSLMTPAHFWRHCSNAARSSGDSGRPSRSRNATSPRSQQPEAAGQWTVLAWCTTPDCGPRTLEDASPPFMRTASVLTMFDPRLGRARHVGLGTRDLLLSGDTSVSMAPEPL